MAMILQGSPLDFPYSSLDSHTAGTVGDGLDSAVNSVVTLVDTANQITITISVDGTTYTLSLPALVSITNLLCSGYVVGATVQATTVAGTKQMGEYFEQRVQSSAPVAITTGTTTNITSYTLPKGDWDVWGQVIFHPAASTTVSAVTAAVSLVSATLPADDLFFSNTRSSGVPAINPTQPTTFRQVSVDADTTVYLVGRTTFGTSTMEGWGTLYGRRWSSRGQ